MNTTTLSDYDKVEYLAFFADKEGIFQTLVNLGKIIIVDQNHVNKTAWVTFDKDGNFLNFYFNEGFWNFLTFYERCFIIGHECLHVLLYHGVRIAMATKKEIANVSADLIVNHLLVSNFSFDEAKLPIAKKLCWRHTVFVNELARVTLPPIYRATYENYYEILSNLVPRLPLSSIDQHDSSGSGSGGSDSPGKSNTNKNDNNQDESKPDEVSIDEMSETDTEDLINKTFGEISDKSVKDFIKKVSEHIPAENTYGPNPYSNHATDARPWKTKENLSWKKIFRTVAKEAYKVSDKEYMQWVRKSRRNNLLPKDLIVPHSVENDEIKKDKPFIHLYIDFSGSCRNLEKDFWLAFDSIPKKLFDVDLYTYSDVIYPVDQKLKKLKGTYGNAPFQIIEKNIQNLLKDKKLKKYPSCVVVLTDGHADGVRPEKPQNWIWILPKGNSTKAYIPKESTIFYLEDIMK